MKSKNINKVADIPLGEEIKIHPEEYPPKYIGVKGNGKIKMVYRVDGELGLVFHLFNHNKSGYRWEHFKTIK
jgi:hypothetical protein